MIRLSIIIPSGNPDLASCSRILQACSWAGPRVEVIVQDRSGNAAKGEFLRSIAQENCRFMIASQDATGEGWGEALATAQGDFVLLLAENDTVFDRAMTLLPGVLESVAEDASTVGVAAPMLIETAQGAEAFAYPNIDADDPLVRLSGYLSADKPNVLLFSPVRRATMTWVLDATRRKPLAFPFDDRISSLLYLISGKFARLTRLMHVCDANASLSQADAVFYEQAGLDPAISRLHWFLCGLEGATLIRHAKLPSAYSPQQRQAMADLWFSAMFSRFKSQHREAFGSPLIGEADKMCAHLRNAAGRMSYANMLADICQFFALASQENALKYFAFWSAMLGEHKAGAA